MKPFYKIVFTLVISTILMSTSGLAEEIKGNPVDLQKSVEKIKTDFEKNIKNTEEFTQSLDFIDAKQTEFAALDIQLDDCISTNTTTLETLKENLKLLGDETLVSEDKDIKAKRKELNQQLNLIDNELKRCSLSKIQLKKFEDEITKRRLAYLKKQLLRKEITVYSGLQSLVIIKDSKEKFDANSKPFLPILDAIKTSISWKGLIFIFVGIFIGWLWKHKETKDKIEPQLLASPTFNSILKGFQRTAPTLLGLVVLWIVIRFSEPLQSSLLTIVNFTFYLTLAFATFRGYFFSRKDMAKESGIPRHRLLLLIFFAIIFSSIAFLLNDQTLGRFSNSETLFLLWFTSMVISTISLILILQFIIHSIFRKSRHGIYLYIPILVMGAMLITAFLGYRNLSSLVFFGTLL